MPRSKKGSTEAGYHSFCNAYLLKNRESTSGKYQLKIRLTVNNQPVKNAPVQKLDAPVIYNGETVKFFEAEFDSKSNRIKEGSLENGELRRFNLFLHQLLLRAVSIGDNVYKQKATISHSDFRRMLYDGFSEANVLQMENIQKELTGDLKSEWDIHRDVSEMFSDTKQTEAEILSEFVHSKGLIDRSGMSTEQVYKKGLYNKNDIFEIYALTYFDDTITNEFYPKIVIRLFEYKERVKPLAQPKHYNKEWILDFFRWFDANGYFNINTKGFDPLKYDRNIFFQKKERKQYEGKSLQKMLNIIKDLSRKFTTRGLLPEVKGLADIRIKDFTKKKDKKGTRKEYSLTKDQFDTLFHHKIIKKDLSQYQEIFNAVNKSTTISITVDDLITAKQMFICQVMFGGLRGWHDYKTTRLQKHSKNEMKIAFHVGKKDDSIENPLNAYTVAVLKETNNEIPLIDNEQYYRSLIKTVVRFINFDKSIKKNKYKNDYQPLSELFQPGFFARKTFAQILRSIDVDPEDIQLFTGHEREDNELKISYLDDNTIENKTKILKKLRIGNGE